MTDYIVYNQAVTYHTGQHFRGYSSEMKFSDIPYDDWKTFDNKISSLTARRVKANKEFVYVQVLHDLSLRSQDVSKIFEFLKLVKPIDWFRDKNCNSYKSVNVYETYIKNYGNGGQFTGQSEVNQMIESYGMEYEFDYEGEMNMKVILESLTQEAFEIALKKFMFLEAMHKFMIKGLKLRTLELAKLFIDTHDMAKPIIPSFFEE